MKHSGSLTNYCAEHRVVPTVPGEPYTQAQRALADSSGSIPDETSAAHDSSQHGDNGDLESGGVVSIIELFFEWLSELITSPEAGSN